MKLGELVKVVSTAEHNTFPVCSDDGRFLGVVTLNEIRNIMFQPRLYDRMKVSDIMIGPPAKVPMKMNMAEVMNLFDTTGAWNLPVIEGGRYMGMLSKNRIFTSYRRVLKHFSED